jgi:predicted glutamine amidotransferase
MCVICVKPKGAKMPSNDIIKAMYKANHDGCGFCTPTKSYKGLSLASFLRELKSVPDEEPCIMHFRWATHGSVKRSNCHPFYDEESKTWFAHNGVLDIRPVGDMTDSETAFRYIIAPEIRQSGLDSAETKEAVKSVIGGSRFAFMQGEEVVMYGTFHYRFGCFYSNLNFVHLIGVEQPCRRFNLRFV